MAISRQTFLYFDNQTNVIHTEALFLLAENQKFSTKEFKAEKRALNGKIHKQVFAKRKTIKLSFLVLDMDDKGVMKPIDIHSAMIDKIDSKVNQIVEIVYGENGTKISFLDLLPELQNLSEPTLRKVSDLTFDSFVGKFDITIESN